MKRSKHNRVVIIRFAFLSALVVPLFSSIDLTGVWNCSDGSRYYIHHAGIEVWWYGEASAEEP
jgi:hypothetical protein